MASKSTGNGFKSPAPVLPAMGLHSFHNDSPPFAAASEATGREPEYLSLSNTSTSPSPLSKQISEPSTASSSVTAPVPIRQQGFAPGQAGLSRDPSSSADDALSTSRSRRLLSGYLFGNPPTDDEKAESPSSHVATTPAPAPPSQPRDSPPASLISETPPEILEESVVGLSLKQNAKGSSEYDRLTGLRDGEADLDESAPQAAFDSQSYLAQAQGESGKYRFPKHRLKTSMNDESKIPLVIVACGSFSPPTYLHLRMFEMAKDEIVESQTYEIMAGYYSPVSSYYKKSGLAPAVHRVRMCELAVEHTSTWLMVDPWEAGQPEYQRTAVVLEHFDDLLNVKGGGVTMSDGKKRKYKIMLLAGGDLIESFGEPGVWSEPDLHIILGRFGCLIVERAGSDVWAFLLSHDILYHHRRNVIVIKQLIYNDISSTKVRLFVKRGMSIKYLLPNSVIQYIYDNKLYR